MLVVDASTPHCVVALGRLGAGVDADLLVDEQDDDGRQASAELHLRARGLFERAQIGPQALAHLACGRGPGTFTGTRVAVALCKGLAVATGLPIVAVSTLAAVAASIEHVGEVLAVLDARRDEVYAAAFTLHGGRVTPRGFERCAAIEEALAAAPGHHVVGPGVAAYAGRIDPGVARTATTGPSARGLWRAAVCAYEAHGPGDAASLEATYLRESYAELGVNVAKRAMFRSPFV